jgi:hypothetical protein
MSRRNALTQLAALPLMMAAGSSVAAETKLPLKIMMRRVRGGQTTLPRRPFHFYTVMHSPRPAIPCRSSFSEKPSH